MNFTPHHGGTHRVRLAGRGLRNYLSMILLVSVLMLLALLALWYQAWTWSQSAALVSTTPVVAAAASATGHVASAPGAAASAATPAEPQPAAADTVTEPKTYTVERYDWLSIVFPNDWKAVCKLNRDILKKGCGHLEAGQVLSLPDGVQATDKSAQAKKPQGKKVVKTVSPKALRLAPLPKMNDAGEILYRVVGTAPLNGCGKRGIADVSREAWQVLGLSNDDQAYLTLNADLKQGPRLNTEAEGRVDMPSGMLLELVTFCRKGKVVAMGPMRTDWADGHPAVKGELFVLPSGRTVIWMRNCFNWVTLHEGKKELPALPPPPAEPPIALLVPPELPIAPPPAPPAPPVEVKDGHWCDRIDMAGALGQHHVPTQNGDNAGSNFLVFLVDCLQRLESNDGSWGLGGKVNYSDWKGSANRGAGHYKGKNASVMVSYRQIMDEGYDGGVAFGPGRQRESYRQDEYTSDTSYTLLALSLSANDYRRRLAGETWDVERQYYGGISLPISSKMSQSWKGTNIADTSGMSRLKVGVQAGGRWWPYETEDLPVLPFVEGGIFVQHPTSASGNLMIGIADPARIVGVGIGVDKDFQNGGDAVLAWGWWADPIQGARVGRSVYRKHQVITDAAARGITIEENGGYIQSIRFGSELLKTERLTIKPAPEVVE